MNERLGVIMLSARVAAFRDMFEEAPEEAVDGAIEARATHALLDSLLTNLPVNTGWIHVLRLADELSPEGNVWFQRIVQAANNALERHALGDALLRYAEDQDEDTLQLANLERAVTDGVFDVIVCRFSKESLETLVGKRIGRIFMTTAAAHRIQHFLEKGDLKRAFDELAYIATSIQFSLPKQFEHWVERVWNAHRDKGLLTDLTDDPNDWRNRTVQIEIRYGQAHTGFRTTKPKKPKIHTQMTNVPMVPLWGPYTGTLPNVQGYAKHWIPIQRAEHGEVCIEDWSRAYFPVAKTGAMLRDMITHWYQHAKERKLREFCAEHKVDYPSPS